MRIKVARDDLARMLDNAKGLVERRTTMPILNNVLLETLQDELSLRSTDLQVTYQGKCHAEVEREGALCLPAHKLAELVKLLPEEHAHLEGKDHDATLTAGKVRYHLKGLPFADFPQPRSQQDQAPPLYLENGAALRNTIGRVAYAASTNEKTQVINGVHLEIRPDGADKVLRLVATNGHRMALCDLELASSETPDPGDGLLLPVKSCSAMHRVLREGAVTLGLSKDLVSLEANGDSLLILPQGPKFPDYSMVLPKAHPHRAVLRRVDLVEALKRVEAIDPAKDRAVNLCFQEGLLELAAFAEVGDAAEHLEMDWDGEEMTMCLNPRYLREACDCLEGDEVTLVLKGPDDVVKVVSYAEQDAGYLGVIVPRYDNPAKGGKK